MQASELLQRINAKSAPVIIDPRSPMEFKKGHIPGAINAPIFTLLLNTAPVPLDRNVETVIACMHGQRAWLAQKLLALRGYRHTDLLDGYLQEWIRAGLPLEQ